jgi:hypothetical protein
MGGADEAVSQPPGVPQMPVFYAALCTPKRFFTKNMDKKRKILTKFSSRKHSFLTVHA